MRTVGGYGSARGIYFGGNAEDVAGLVADALAVFDHVHARHGNVAVIGRSLGSGVAVQLAAARPIERPVLVTAYDSLANVAREYFRTLDLSPQYLQSVASDEQLRGSH